MSMDGHCTKRRRKIAENFNRLSWVHQRHRQTDGIAIAYTEKRVSDERSYLTSSDLFLIILDRQRLPTLFIA